MTLPLLQTKLAIPYAAHRLVERPHLLDRLDEGIAPGNKLVLLTAPPGSGKTTLLSAWTWRSTQARNPAQRGFGWLSLEPSESDPVRFWSYLSAALDPVRPGIAATVQTVLNGDPLHAPSLELALTVLINALNSRQEQVIVILDDYHVIHSETIHQNVSFLIDHLPPHAHLAIASRSTPPLPLSRWRARNQLTELHAPQLNFSTNEASDFFEQVMNLDLSADEIAWLESRTEGWIAGLQLAGLSLQNPSAHAMSAVDISGNQRHIADYLVDEVLSRQPSSIQDFLLKTSLLERLTASLCDAVMGEAESSSSAVLEYLERANLFLIPLDAERRWYRYHHLFAELLRSKLEHAHPDLFPVIHARAATWFEQNHFLEHAIHHRLMAGEFGKAIRLFEPQAQGMVFRGEYGLLTRWMNQIPIALLQDHPRLILARLWSAVLAGHLLEVEAGLQKLVQDDSLPKTIVGQIAALRAVIATIRQNIPAIQTQAQTALAHLPSDESVIRGFVSYAMGSASYYLGELPQAIAQLEHAIQESDRSHLPIFRIVASASLAQAVEASGRLDRAAQIHQDLIALEKDPVAGNLPLIGIGYVGIAGILHEWNELEQAEQALQKGLVIGQRWGSTEILAGGYLTLARLRYTQCRFAEMQTILEQAKQTSAVQAERWSITALQALGWLAQGQLAKALAWAEKHPLMPDEIPSYEDEFQILVAFRILMTARKPTPGMPWLAKLADIAEKNQCIGGLIEIRLLQARVSYAQGKVQAALSFLEQALDLGAPQRYYRVFIDESGLQPILAAFLAEYPDHAYAVDLQIALEQRLALLQGKAPLLSQREMDVLHLMAAGLSNQDIADRLMIGLTTVKTHVKHIMSKLDTDNRTAAVARARELHLV